MEPLVTIGIPTYNRGDERLQRVVDAACNQDWKNLEILVSDNASSDDTETLMRNVSDPRVKYIRQEKNLGANGNFNYLLQEAKGEWFLLFHDDDLIDSDFVSSCMSVVTPEHRIGFIRTGVRSIDASGKVLKETKNQLSGPSREDFYFSWFASKTATFLCSTLYHTQRLRDVGGFDSLHFLLEDNYALVKLLEHWDHANITEAKASYRYTYDQRTYNVPVIEWCQDFRQLLDMIMQQCQPDTRRAIWFSGLRFFRQLCMLRVNAIDSKAKHRMAKLVVKRYFGFPRFGYILATRRNQ
jgi:glycosyltransferase involved in cell wall biosynthesis